MLLGYTPEPDKAWDAKGKGILDRHQDPVNTTRAQGLDVERALHDTGYVSRSIRLASTAGGRPLSVRGYVKVCV